ncbi:SCO-spondin-like [Amphiura filiformis]|uniref:SCO-spondin-like n=1 Tax=Amphiura filiformis TaxID=82378 RepID=UPI003B220F0D
MEETEFCNTDACPIDGNWNPWSEWTPCDTTCNGGTTFRYRLCNDPLPKNDGADCEGDPMETMVCNPQPCNETICENGKVYEEGCVSSCPYHCADLQAGTQCVEDVNCEPGCRCPEGTLEQNGECVPQEQCDCLDEEGNLYAPDDNIVEECKNCTCINGTYMCEEYDCPIDCGWSSWSTWTECSETCGNGTQYRFRSGNNPTALNGGDDCVGDSEDQTQCNLSECPTECVCEPVTCNLGYIPVFIEAEDECCPVCKPVSVDIYTYLWKT